MSYTFCVVKKQTLYVLWDNQRKWDYTEALGNRWSSVALSPDYDKWVTSSGQTENNSAKCIIHGKRPRVSNCFHLSALLVQMLLNSVKKLCSVMGGGGWEGGHVGHNAAYSRFIIRLCCGHQGRGWAGGNGVGWAGGGRDCRLGKNPLADWEEETALLSSKVMRHSSSGKVNFLYNSTDCVQISSTFVFSSEWEDKDGLRRGSSWYVKNRNTLIKGNKYGALDGS